MGTLNTAIRLNDQMTSQLNAAAEATEKLVNMMGRLDTVLQSVGGASVDNLSSAMDATSRATEEAEKSQRAHNEALTAGASNANALLGKIKGIVAAYLSIKSVNAIVDASDELTSSTARLQMMVQNFAGDNTAADQISAQTDNLMNQVYAAASRSRASVGDLMNVVGRFGNNARDAFSSTDEVVRFAELVQKQMTIAGASTQEASNAILQLSQALGSGVLRGDELNSIFEQAPNLIQRIADYMGVSIGQIRELASEGQLSADVVKNAVLSAGSEIDEQFASMPRTFAQTMTLIKNQALQSFQPVLDRLNDALNSDMGTSAMQTAFNGLAVAANVVMNAMEALGNAIQWVQQNSAWLEPVAWGLVAALTAYATAAGICAAIEGVSTIAKGFHAAASAIATTATLAQTAAQYGLNAALAACPITWIVVAVLAAVTALIAFGTWAATSAGIANSAIGTVAGAVMTAVAFVQNLFVGLINYVITLGVGLYNMFVSFADAFGMIFNNPVAAIEALMLSMLNFILSIVSAAAGAIDAVFGSNLQSAVEGFQAKVQAKVDEKITEGGGTNTDKLTASNYLLERASYSDAWNTGAEWGDNLSGKLKTALNGSSLSSGLSDLGDFGGSAAASSAATADNTGSINDKLDDTEEDIAYLCDIAERDAINRFTTASINVDMTNNNTVNSGLDLDGIMNDLAVSLNGAMAQVAEGSHVA